MDTPLSDRASLQNIHTTKEVVRATKDLRIMWVALVSQVRDLHTLLTAAASRIRDLRTLLAVAASRIRFTQCTTTRASLQNIPPAATRSTMAPVNLLSILLVDLTT